MAESKEYIKANYPLPVYNYRVAVLEDDDAPSMSFAEVTGLSFEYEPVTYKHGFSFAMGSVILKGMKQPLRITMRKGIVQSNNALYQWINKSYNAPFYDKAKRDILVDLCDENGAAIVRWTVQRAMPVKLDAPGFDANSNDVAIETMELIAHGLRVENVV